MEQFAMDIMNIRQWVAATTNEQTHLHVPRREKFYDTEHNNQFYRKTNIAFETKQKETLVTLETVC